VIVGIGLDLVEIDRVAAARERHGEAFLRRILHDDERSERVAVPSHLAGLFAAKEAVMKALGTGMAGASFAEILVRHHPSGQPHVELRGQTRELASRLGVGAWQLSITHSRTAAAAVAIALSA